jgi:hypothetical protein
MAGRKGRDMTTFRAVTIAAAIAALLSAQAAAAQPQPASKAANPGDASLDPRVKLKDGDRYLRDLSAALEIPRAEVCKELGQYDCFNDAFRIVLGGVDAANLALNEPLSQDALTAPIALDRLALHVCVNRVQKDLADPAHAVLLKGAKAGAKPSPAWMKHTVNEIYGRILSRDPSPAETAKLVGFYGTVEVSPGPAAERAKTWVTLSCFAVASSVENVFY